MAPATTTVRARTIWDGIAAVRQAYVFLRSHRGTWPAALVPILTFAAVVAVGAYWGWAGAAQLAARWFGGVETWYGHAGAWLARMLSSAAVLIVVLWIALLASPVLSAPALEHLVRQQAQALGCPVHSPHGLLGELRCGLQAQFFALRWLGPAFLLLWAVDLLAPPLSLLTLPLKLLLSAASVAWGLLDYPMTLAGLSPRERLKLVAGHKRAVFGFSVCFGALFFIPFVGLLMLPVGVTAATRLMAAFVRPEDERHSEAVTSPPPSP